MYGILSWLFNTNTSKPSQSLFFIPGVALFRGVALVGMPVVSCNFVDAGTVVVVRLSTELKLPVVATGLTVMFCPWLKLMAAAISNNAVSLLGLICLKENKNNINKIHISLKLLNVTQLRMKTKRKLNLQFK